MKTALILAGAGARGIIQAGMIKAFVDKGLQYDALYGSSVGALNGALLHAGQIDDMLNLWMTVKNNDVYRQAPWNIFTPGKGCLYDSTPLKKLIQKTIRFDYMRLNPRPFSVNVTNLDDYSATRFVFGRGQGGLPIPEWDALYASASPPVLMPPVESGVGTLTDGGVTNNYSIIDAVHDGADRLVVLAPMVPQPKPIKTIIDAIDATISIQLWNQLQRELKFVEKLNSIEGYRKVEVIVITAKPTNIGILDFNIKDRKSQIDYGYDLVARCAKLN